MTHSRPFGVPTMSDALRRCVYELAGASNDLYSVDRQTTSLTSLRPTTLTCTSEQDRAEVCLATLNAMLSMQAGDKLTVEWHDRSDGDGRMATLTLTQGGHCPLGRWR